MGIIGFFSLAWASLSNRKTSVILTVLSVAFSVSLFLGVDKLRRGAEDGFNATISGTDVIVGARSGPINLLLYSIFSIGEPATNVSWESYERYADHPDVAWTVPLSLGDSHRGFRVLGTTSEYFTRYQYADEQNLQFSSGLPFAEPLDAVVGAAVAEELGYEMGDQIFISHGLVATEFNEHKNAPFTIVGVLARTGTPVDRRVHVSLAGIEAMHEGVLTDDHDHGEEHHQATDDHDDHDHEDEHAHDDDHAHGDDHDHEDHLVHDHDCDEDHHDTEDEHASDHSHADHDHPTEAITAFLIGAKQPVLALRIQREVNTDEEEALTAILPGMTLTQLWQVVGTVQLAFIAIAGFVVVTGLLGLLTTILTSLNERRREIAALRAVGAQRKDIFSMLVAESALLAALGAALGALIVYGGLAIIGPILQQKFGVPLAGLGPSAFDAAMIVGVVGLATLLGFFPAWRAYKNSLTDGLNAKV